MVKEQEPQGNNQDHIYGMLGRAIANGDEYTAGQIGYAALLGGVNLNQALSGKGDK